MCWQPARPARLFNKSVRARWSERVQMQMPVCAVAIKECYAGAKVAIKSPQLASMQLNGPADFSINSHKRARARGVWAGQRRRRKLLETLINAIAIADIHFKQYCPPWLVDGNALCVFTPAIWISDFSSHHRCEEKHLCCLFLRIFYCSVLQSNMQFVIITKSRVLLHTPLRINSNRRRLANKTNFRVAHF